MYCRGNMYFLHKGRRCKVWDYRTWNYWKNFRWEITFLTFSASQYIFFVSTDSALSLTRDLDAPDTFTRDLGAPDTYHIEEICLSYIFLKLINEVAFLMTIGKLFHLLITHKLKKFLLISRLQCWVEVHIVCRTLSSSSISDLSQSDQAWTQYSRRGRTYTL